MTLKQRLIENGFAAEHVPGGYQILGDVLLAKFPFGVKISAKEKKDIARAIAQILPNIRAVGEINRVSGELRKPKVSLLFSKEGGNLETVHIEHGITFKLDPSKVMFSKGNLSERARLVSKIMPYENIVDMFAGIGYFSLGIAKHAPQAKIYAIEKNPVAFGYLEENISLNGLHNISAVKGDCRKVRIKEKADRVLMGYFVSNAERSHKSRVRRSEQRRFPHTEKFLAAAFRLLKPRGIIHYHNIYSEQDMRSKPVEEIEKAAAKAGYRVSGIAHHTVKSYAPRVWHVVVDAEVVHNE